MATIWTPDELEEHRLIWADALESGKYQQGTGVLHRGNQFCVMGVACDVMRSGDVAAGSPPRPLRRPRCGRHHVRSEHPNARQGLAGA